MKNKTKIHYGHYALPFFVSFSAIILIAGTLVWFWVWWIPGAIILGIGLYFVVICPISLITMKQSDPSILPKDILNLKGDEKVLDVGCGLGKATIAVAKQLKTGKAVGIDIWSKMEIPGNLPERAYANAKLEGVRDKVEFKTGNVLNLEFEDNSFDVVTSSSVINNLHSESQKLVALKEIFRVLRPEGKFLLLEPLRDSWNTLLWTPFFVWMLLPKDEWIRLLNKSGFVNLKYSNFEKMGVFLTQKPATVK